MSDASTKQENITSASSKETDMSKDEALKLLKEEAEAIGIARNVAIKDILAKLEATDGKTILKEEMQRQKALRKSREVVWKQMEAKEAKISKLADHFSAYDVDDSNAIDMEEFKLLCQDLMMKQKNLTESFKNIDADGSGQIEFEEFKDWYEQEKRSSSAGKRISRFFKKRVKELGNLSDAAHARKAIIKQIILKSDAKTRADFAKVHPDIETARAMAPAQSPPSRLGFPKQDRTILNAERQAESNFNKDTANLLKKSHYVKDLDTNHDGVLSTAELVVALNKKNNDSAIQELGTLRENRDSDESDNEDLTSTDLAKEKQAQLQDNLQNTTITSAKVVSPIATIEGGSNDDDIRVKEASENDDEGAVRESPIQSDCACCTIV